MTDVEQFRDAWLARARRRGLVLVHAVVPLDQVAVAHRAVAKGWVRGRYVLQP